MNSASSDDATARQRAEENMALVLDTLNAQPRDAAPQNAVAALQDLDGGGPPTLNHALYNDIRGAAPDVLPLSNGYIVTKDPTQGSRWIAFSTEAFLQACTEDGHIGRNPAFRAQVPVEVIDRLADHSGVYLEGMGATMAADRQALHARAREIARTVNPNVDLAIVDRLYGEGEALAASGGRSIDRQPVAGLYFKTHRVAAVSDDPSRGDLIEGIYHEYFHTLEPLLTQKERDALAKALPAFEAAYGEAERKRLDMDLKDVGQQIADLKAKAEKDDTIPGIELRTLEDRERFLKQRLDQGVRVFQGATAEERIAEMVAKVAAAGERGQDVRQLLRVAPPQKGLGQRLDEWRKLNGWNSWRDAVSSILGASKVDGQSTWHRFTDAVDKWQQTRGMKTWEQKIDQSIVQACAVVEKARSGKVAERAAVFDASGKISVFEAARIARETGADRLAANYESMASRSKDGMVPAQMLWGDLKQRAGRTDGEIREALTRSGYQVIKDTARRTTLTAEVDALARQSLERMTKSVPLSIGETGAAAANLGRRPLGSEAGAMASRPAPPEQRDRPVHMMTFAEFTAAAVQRGLVTHVPEQQKLDANGRAVYDGTRPVRSPAVYRLVMPDGSQPLPDIPESSIRQHLGAAGNDPARCAQEAIRAYHRAFVKAAAQEGRYVPARVIADHPDLRGQGQAVVIDDPRLVNGAADRQRRAVITSSAVPGALVASVGTADPPPAASKASQAYSLGGEQELAWSRDGNGVLVAGGNKGIYAIVRDNAGGSHLFASGHEGASHPPIALLREADAVAAANAVDRGTASLARVAEYAASERRERQPEDPAIRPRPDYLGGGVDVFDVTGPEARKIGVGADAQAGQQVLRTYNAAEQAATGPWSEPYRRPLDVDQIYQRDLQSLDLPVDRDELRIAADGVRVQNDQAPEAAARLAVLEDRLARVENEQARRGQSQRLYLEVPPEEAMAAIGMGAKVDLGTRALYLPHDVPEAVQRELLTKYRPHSEAARDRTYLDVQGKDVADAVRAGAAFDTVNSRFYVPEGLAPSAKEHLKERWGKSAEAAAPLPDRDIVKAAADRAEPVDELRRRVDEEQRRRQRGADQPGQVSTVAQAGLQILADVGKDAGAVVMNLADRRQRGAEQAPPGQARTAAPAREATARETREGGAERAPLRPLSVPAVQDQARANGQIAEGLQKLAPEALVALHRETHQALLRAQQASTSARAVRETEALERGTGLITQEAARRGLELPAPQAATRANSRQQQGGAEM
jgi:hypothetical protein